MDDRKSHCHEASLYKSHERRKGTEYGYLPAIEVQMVVAWSVANRGMSTSCANWIATRKVAPAFSKRASPASITCIYVQY